MLECQKTWEHQESISAPILWSTLSPNIAPSFSVRGSVRDSVAAFLRSLDVATCWQTVLRVSKVSMVRSQQVLNSTPLNPNPATCHKRKQKLRCKFRKVALQKLHCNIRFSAVQTSFLRLSDAMQPIHASSVQKYEIEKKIEKIQNILWWILPKKYEKLGCLTFFSARTCRDFFFLTVLSGTCREHEKSLALQESIRIFWFDILLGAVGTCRGFDFCLLAGTCRTDKRSRAIFCGYFDIFWKSGKSRNPTFLAFLPCWCMVIIVLVHHLKPLRHFYRKLRCNKRKLHCNIEQAGRLITREAQCYLHMQHLHRTSANTLTQSCFI